jgi:hypothetical protein
MKQNVNHSLAHKKRLVSLKQKQDMKGSEYGQRIATAGKESAGDLSRG